MRCKTAVNTESLSVGKHKNEQWSGAEQST